MWQPPTVGPRPAYRVSYIQQTGEVYAVATGDFGPVLVLAIVPPDQGEIYYETLNELMEGWANRPRTLDWLRDRLQFYSPRARAANTTSGEMGG